MGTYQDKLVHTIEDFMLWEDNARKEYLQGIAQQFCKEVENFDANDIDKVQNPAFQKLLKKLKPYMSKDKVVRLQVQELLISRLRNR